MAEMSSRAAAPAYALPRAGSDAVARGGAPEAQVRDYWALLKPRVMSLVIFTAFVGLVMAPTPVHPVVALASLLCVAVGAGASGALNMWWDADIDRLMKRTAARPIPSGRIQPDEALTIGATLSVLSVALLLLFANALAAGLLATTILYYLVVYSMWLKRRTALNIVIGGAAGAFPPVIGWAAATGGVSIEPLILFAIIFLWTPPHSWALALASRADYARVGVPMLPVAAGDVETRRQIWLYALALAGSAAAPFFVPGMAGPVYALVAPLMTWRMLSASRALSRRTESQAVDDGYRAEWRYFALSIAYLFALFSALLVDVWAAPAWRALLAAL